MDLIISIGIGLIILLFVGFYFIKNKSVFNLTTEELRRCSALFKVNNKLLFLVVNSIIGILLIIESVYLYNNVSNIINLIKLLSLSGILSACAVVDLRKRIIPNILVLSGLIVRVILYIFEFVFYRELFTSQLLSDLMGFGIGFGILFISCVITKGAIGFGDVKLFGMIGLMTGAICTYSTLIFSLISSSIISLCLILIKKKKRKDSIPFGPFILFGYTLAVFLSCF